MRRLAYIRSMTRTISVAALQLALPGPVQPNIDAVAALAPRGLTVPTGSCPSVGLAGFSMGGGIGALSRAHGLGADALEALTIVTPDGAVQNEGDVGVKLCTELELLASTSVSVLLRGSWQGRNIDHGGLGAGAGVGFRW